MENTYLLADPNCVQCRQFGTTDELNLSQGKIYGANIFNIPGSFVRNSQILGATKFYGFSISQYGRFVYKQNNVIYDSQKIAFSNLDTLYVTRKNNKWMLGVS